MRGRARRRARSRARCSGPRRGCSPVVRERRTRARRFFHAGWARAPAHLPGRHAGQGPHTPGSVATPRGAGAPGRWSEGAARRRRPGGAAPASRGGLAGRRPTRPGSFLRVLPPARSPLRLHHRHGRAHGVAPALPRPRRAGTAGRRRHRRPPRMRLCDRVGETRAAAPTRVGRRGPRPRARFAAGHGHSPGVLAGRRVARSGPHSGLSRHPGAPSLRPAGGCLLPRRRRTARRRMRAVVRGTGGRPAGRGARLVGLPLPRPPGSPGHRHPRHRPGTMPGLYSLVHEREGPSHPPHRLRATHRRPALVVRARVRRRRAARVRAVVVDRRAPRWAGRAAHAPGLGSLRRPGGPRRPRRRHRASRVGTRVP